MIGGSFYGSVPYLNGRELPPDDGVEKKCHKCNGTGVIHTQMDDTQVSDSQWVMMTQEEKDNCNEEYCPDCGGWGYIEKRKSNFQ